MKNRLSQGLIQGLKILQQKYRAELDHNQIQSARKLVEQDFNNQYGLKNKKLRIKKEQKGAADSIIADTIQNRKENNKKMKINFKNPLIQSLDKFPKDNKKIKKNTNNHARSYKKAHMEGTQGRFFEKNNSSITKITQKSSSSQIKSIVGRLSKGDQRKQKYLIELCKQNFNEQHFKDQDIFGIKPARHTTYQLCNEDFQKKSFIQKSFIQCKLMKTPQSLKETASNSRPQLSIQNSMDNSYVVDDNKRHSKIVISPLMFEYDEETTKKSKKQKLRRIIRGKNCRSENSKDY